MPEFIDPKTALHMDPGLHRVSDAPQKHAGSLEIVVPYTSCEMTAKVMRAAAALAHGLNVTLRLVAVYVAPYPADLWCPAATREHLAARLSELAGQPGVPANVHLVVARDRDTGFRSALRPHSIVLLGSRKRIWRTREEKLARELTREGHLVSLLHFD